MKSKTHPTDKKFIQKGIKHPGRLTKAAASAGMSVNAYAKKHYHDPQGTIGDAARLYINALKR